MTGSITRSRSGEMHVPGPTELNQADLDRAAKTLARLCVRNGGNPAELALTLGAIGYLPPEAAERAAELLATPVHRPGTAEPATAPLGGRLCHNDEHPMAGDNLTTQGECRACRNRKRAQTRRSRAKGGTA